MNVESTWTALAKRTHRLGGLAARCAWARALVSVADGKGCRTAAQHHLYVIVIALCHPSFPSLPCLSVVCMSLACSSDVRAKRVSSPKGMRNGVGKRKTHMEGLQVNAHSGTCNVASRRVLT